MIRKLTTTHASTADGRVSLDEFTDLVISKHEEQLRKAAEAKDTMSIWDTFLTFLEVRLLVLHHRTAARLSLVYIELGSLRTIPYEV